MVKKVGKNIYAHKSNLKELFAYVSNEDLLEIKKIIDNFHLNQIEVIKYDMLNHKISFIESPDWDIANEPVVGNSYVYNLLTKSWKTIYARKTNKQIYHNKWQFVNEDYQGFDIQKAKERTILWNSIPNINQMKKYIGNQNYWIALLKQYNIEQ